jgi:hypothetical protein
VSKLSRSFVVVALALAPALACARLAGLDDPDPPASNGSGSSPDSGSPGVILGDGITLKPESIALTTSCAGNDDAQYISLENQGDKDWPYELQVPEGSAFQLRDGADASVRSLTGTLPAKRILLVYLRVTSTKAGNFGGQVIVRVGEHTKSIPVNVTMNGGALAISPTLVDFGEVRQNTASPPQTVEIKNTGTEAVNVTGLGAAAGSDAGTEFDVSFGSAASVNIPPGETANATVTLVAGPAGAKVTSTLEPRTQSPTCGELPTLTLSGTRVNTEVTVNPISLGFGSVGCGVGGATKTVTISNFSNMPASFTAAAPAISWFTVDPASGTVPREMMGVPGTATVTVTLKPVPTFGNRTDAIDIIVAEPAKTTTVLASVMGKGAVLSISPMTLSGFAPDETKSYLVRNVGNDFIYVRNTSSDGAFTVDGTTALFPDNPFGFGVGVKFVAQGSGTHNATITTMRISSPPFVLPESGTFCEAPGVVNVTAKR